MAQWLLEKLPTGKCRVSKKNYFILWNRNYPWWTVAELNSIDEAASLIDACNKNKVK